MNEKYIQALRDTIRHMHGCASRYIETVPVNEEFKGQTAWKGDVEVFDLAGHPKARRCYAWGYRDDTGKWQYVAVLRVPPVESPVTAVRAYILTQQERRTDTQ